MNTLFHTPSARMCRLAFTFLLVSLAVVGCQNASSTGDVADVAETHYELVTVDAASFTEAVGEIDADIRIINIWATWCGPCHVEMPEFVRFGKEMADESVAVRFLSIDNPDVLPQVERFVADYGISGPTYFSGTGDLLIQNIHPRWQFGLPTTLMIDREMRIRDVWEGAVNYDFLVAKVERMRGILAEESGSAVASETSSTGS